MKQKVNDLLDRLADKTLSFGCYIKTSDGMPGIFVGGSSAGNLMVYNKSSYKVWSKKPNKNHKILGHPITIGGVFEVLSRQMYKGKFTPLEHERILNKITDLWLLLDFTKSLQELVEASGWTKRKKGQHRCDQKLLDPNTRFLVEYLLKIL